MPWKGRGPSTSGVAEWMSLSLLNPSACRRYVRAQPAGHADAARGAAPPARHLGHDRLRAAHGDPEIRDHRLPPARRVLDLQDGRTALEAGLGRGHVVGRERVVGPARQEEDRVLSRALPEVEHEGVLARIPADAMAGEA